MASRPFNGRSEELNHVGHDLHAMTCAVVEAAASFSSAESPSTTMWKSTSAPRMAAASGAFGLV